VIAIADGLARNVDGLPEPELNEIVVFSNGARGFVMTLEEDEVQVAFLDPADGITAGTAVTRSGEILSVPVGERCSEDTRPAGPAARRRSSPRPPKALPVERPAPDDHRSRFRRRTAGNRTCLLSTPSSPSGRGQRELIIGERQTGKTSVAVDAILNQAGGDVICIYVAIGQRTSAVARIIDALRSRAPWSAAFSSSPSPRANPGCAGSRPSPQPAWPNGSATSGACSDRL
jgi:F-type H+-transporting ATPase subunit alpha